MAYQNGIFRRTPLALLRGGLAACCIMAAVGCVDHRYDLKGDLDLTIGVGGDELVVPVGTTEKITLQKLIGSDDDELTVMPDGSYALTQQDSVLVKIPQIAPITFQTKPFALGDMYPDFNKGLFPPSGSGGALPPLTALPVAQVSSLGDIEIDALIPSEVQALERVTFVSPVEARISFDVTGVNTAIRKMRFEDLHVVFPPFITLASGGHEVVLNDEFNVADGYSHSIEIASLDFTPPLDTRGSVHIDDQVELSGYLRITDMASGGDLTNITLKPALTIGDMQVKLVVGRVAPQIPQVNQVLGLEDIPDFLRGQGTVLDVNPYINLTIANPLGMQVDVQMELMPVIGRQEYPENKSDVHMRVAGTDVPGRPAWSYFRVSENAEGIPVDYTFVDAPNLPNLLRTIPDTIRFDVASSLVPGTTQSMDLSLPEYTIRLDYELCVPLSFGPDLSIHYRDTVDNLAKDIGDFVDKVKEVRILANVDNTVPLELQAAAVAVDLQKQPLKGVEVSAPQKIAPGNGTDTPVVSSFDVVIRETDPGALARLDGLILEITAGNNASVAHIPATPNQYVQVKMKLRVPGGIIMDMDDL